MTSRIFASRSLFVRAREVSAVAVAFALLLLCTGAAGAEEKIRVAVVDFNTDALHSNWRYGWHWSNLARAAADNLANQLVQTGEFRVIERQQLDKVLAEQNLGESGRVDPSTAARLGKILGVQLVIIGSVTEFGISEKGGRIPQIGRWKWGRGVGGKMITGRSALSARMVDTTTAEILGAWDAEGDFRTGKGEFAGANFGTNWDSGVASKCLAEAVEKLAQEIASGASGIEPSTVRGGMEGKIAKVDGDRIYLNVGSDDGVKVGDRFEIRSLGEEIVDPDTGEVLGAEESPAGTVEVTKVIGGSLSIAKPVGGGPFSVGDRAVSR